MPLSIPGSTVPIVKMMPPEISGEREEASLELKTSKPHDFKKGQRVVITGVRCVTEDAPEVAPEVDGVQKLAASLNATHVAGLVVGIFPRFWAPEIQHIPMS